MGIIKVDNRYYPTVDKLQSNRKFSYDGKKYYIYKNEFNNKDKQNIICKYEKTDNGYVLTKLTSYLETWEAKGFKTIIDAKHYISSWDFTLIEFYDE